MQKKQFRNNTKNYTKSYSKSEDLPKKNILGVDITNATKEEVLEFIVKNLQNLRNPYYIVTPNPEMIMLANKNSDFRMVLNNAKIALNDGVGIGVAARVLGIPLGDRFTGVELVEKLCEKANDWPITVGFLGSGSKIAEMASECLRRRFPKLKVVFADDHWPGESIVINSKGKGESVKGKENKKPLYPLPVTLNPSIDILFVAFGAPKQEFWMQSHLGKIPVRVMVGVGGSLDQIAHPSLRPPTVLQNLGLGWLYRLVRQPWRWKRQLALLEFMWLIVKARFDKTS